MRNLQSVVNTDRWIEIWIQIKPGTKPFCIAKVKEIGVARATQKLYKRFVTRSWLKI